jgi:hypothetical protein
MSVTTLEGTVFGGYTVLSLDTSVPLKPKRYMCRCICGTVNSVIVANLKQGLSKSCGCLGRKINSDKRTIDRVGDTYNRLTVIKRVENKGQSAAWLCICSCGNKIEASGSKLSSGNVKSCGCLQKENASKANSSHGMTNTKEYRSWAAMKTRCLNDKRENYEHYGGRGITICESWTNSFENFIEDLGKSPSNEHTLERDNVNGNYEPDNCRWASQKEQARNRRSSKRVEWNGTVITLAELSELTKVDYNLLQFRISRGWTVEDSVNTPSKRKRVQPRAL